MDSRYLLLPLFALPWLLRRADRSVSRTSLTVDKPFITSIELPPSFRKRSRRTSSIDAIVLHCTEGGPDALKSAQHALRPVEQGGRRASFHNVIGRDGMIVQLVPWEQQAWHCSSMPGLLEISWNNRSIGIEICALPQQRMTAVQERALVGLVRYLLHRYTVPVENITAHRFTGANTSCPDALFPTHEAFVQWRQQHFAQE
jgi:N-acetyl-anhydromuramyl-L-alanine amidase AmpD